MIRSRTVMRLVLLTVAVLSVRCMEDEDPQSFGLMFDAEMQSISRSIGQLTRQLMAESTAREERVRSDGNSGLKQIRLRRYGDRSYASESYTGSSFAGIHDHSNNIRTVGMGEVIAVLNGVEFRTRHNDYQLVMPSTSSQGYHDVEDIPFPAVPPEVLEKQDVAEQIEEMQEFFRAWKTQNVTHRNYTEYFKPVLCYLEGAWTKGQDEIDEPFFSDRHALRANTWFELLEQIRMTSYTGSKDNGENLAYLPTKIITMNGEEPIFAQYNYRILCHPLKRDIPLDSFEVVDDLSSRITHRRSLEDHVDSRGARFRLKDGPTSLGYLHGILDEIMEEIPGKNNYGADISDDSMDGMEQRNLDDTIKNVGYYHRVFKVAKNGAMGTKTVPRGFNDPNLFVAINNQTEVAAMSRDICSGWGSRRTCELYSVKASWAIPLEIIYLTPLQSWNPYNIHYKGIRDTPEGRTIYEPNWSRNGYVSLEKAYNGSNSKAFYHTPAAFFGTGKVQGDTADTSRYNVGVLDRNGDLRETRASGVRVLFPSTISDLGVMRQRFPIAPIHEEGSSTRKELDALKDGMAQKDEDMKNHMRLVMSILKEKDGADTTRIMTVTMGESRSNDVDAHTHTIDLSADDLYDLRVLNKHVMKITSEAEGHYHVVVLMKNWSDFKIVKCDGVDGECTDRHSLYIKATDH